MKYSSINIEEKFAAFTEQWRPKIIAQVNDYQIKIVRITGEFVRHRHEETDELFLVVKGAMRIEFRDGYVSLEEGELFVVPKGIEHRPVAERECLVLLIEPAGTINTGDSGGDMTAPNDAWI
ncbi:MAG: cupin domain-containing protein [Candidatus Zixiibacteriota bacterium]